LAAVGRAHHRPRQRDRYRKELPSWPAHDAFRRTLADGDLAVLEVELTNADGSRYFGVRIIELRDGKVAGETDYYAQPFQAPEWRAQWVERT
jgi:hypothetical protein